MKITKLAMAACLVLLTSAAVPSFAASDNSGAGNGAHGEVGDNPNATDPSPSGSAADKDCVRTANNAQQKGVCPDVPNSGTTKDSLSPSTTTTDTNGSSSSGNGSSGSSGNGSQLGGTSTGM